MRTSERAATMRGCGAVLSRGSPLTVEGDAADPSSIRRLMEMNVSLFNYVSVRRDTSESKLISLNLMPIIQV